MLSINRLIFKIFVLFLLCALPSQASLVLGENFEENYKMFLKSQRSDIVAFLNENIESETEFFRRTPQKINRILSTKNHDTQQSHCAKKVIEELSSFSKARIGMLERAKSFFF